MFEGAPQSIFTPISSSAEYIGSHVVFNSVPPTHELPLGCDVDASQQGDYLLAHYLGYDGKSADGNRMRYSCKAGLGSQAANQRAKQSDPGDDGPMYIQSFSLLHSHIGDTGLNMNPVVDAILQMASIEKGPRLPILELNLGFCSLTENSAPTIVALLNGLPSLQRLTLVGNLFGNIINVLDNDALLGDFNAMVHIENEVSSREAINSKESDSEEESNAIEGSSVLGNFVALLSESWASHPNLSQLIVDPWLFERFPTLEAIRKRRVPLLRKQAAVTGRKKTALARYASALIEMHSDDVGKENASPLSSKSSMPQHFRHPSIRDDEAEDFTAFAPSQRFQNILNDVLRNAASFLSKPQSSGAMYEMESTGMSASNTTDVVGHLTLVELQAREAIVQEESELYQSILSQQRLTSSTRKSVMMSQEEISQQWWENSSMQSEGKRRDAGARGAALRKRINDFLSLEAEMRARHEKREADAIKKISQQQQAVLANYHK